MEMVRHSGQEWSCAKCHQFKRDCPGAAVARDCTAERTLLSAYMVEHWNKIGYKPELMNEVDQVELEVQVGGKKKEQIVIPENSLSSKYRSVIVKGFKADTPLETLLEVFKQEGLLSGFKLEDILRNEESGSLTLVNVKPEECLTLVEMMNRKRFLNRFIHVTSVVADSPVKQPPEQVTDKSLIQHSNPQSGQQSNTQIKDTSAQVVVTLKVPGQRPGIPPTNPVPSLDLGKTLTPRSSDQFEDADHSQYVFGPVSPGVLEKISNLEKQSENSKFFNRCH